MKIKEMNEENRPVEKLIRDGAKALSNEELLAIILRNGSKDKSSIELAQLVINSVSNLNMLCDLKLNDLKKIVGIKNFKGAIILAMFEFVKRCKNNQRIEIYLKEPREIFEYIKPKIEFAKVENIYVIYVNPKCKIIECNHICEGGSARIHFDYKLIITKGLKLNCYGIILIHNHPSLDVNPSKSDIEVTNKMKKMCELLDINLLDHLIVCENKYFSFLENDII